MYKFFFVLFVCSAAQLASAQSITCSYEKLADGTYVCNLNLQNSVASNGYVSIPGTHMSGMTNKDVKVVRAIDGSVSILIPSIICQTFPSLENLTLTRVGLTDIRANSLSACLNLKILDVSNNFITTIDETAFVNNVNLRELSFAMNRLSTIPARTFHSLKMLVDLDIGLNKLTTIDPNWFSYTTQLEHVSLYKNMITDIPSQTFVLLYKLKTLYLFNNQLTVIRYNAFGALPLLQEFDVSYNKINAVEKAFFDNNSPYIDMTGNVCSNLAGNKFYYGKYFGLCWQNYLSL